MCFFIIIKIIKNINYYLDNLYWLVVKKTFDYKFGKINLVSFH